MYSQCSIWSHYLQSRYMINTVQYAICKLYKLYTVRSCLVYMRTTACIQYISTVLLCNLSPLESQHIINLKILVFTTEKLNSMYLTSRVMNLRLLHCISCLDGRDDEAKLDNKIYTLANTIFLVA